MRSFRRYNCAMLRWTLLSFLVCALSSLEGRERGVVSAQRPKHLRTKAAASNRPPATAPLPPVDSEVRQAIHRNWHRQALIAAQPPRKVIKPEAAEGQRPLFGTKGYRSAVEGGLGPSAVDYKHPESCGSERAWRQLESCRVPTQAPGVSPVATEDAGEVTGVCRDAVMLMKTTKVWRNSHMPSLAQLGDGTLVAAWQGATFREGETAQRLWTSLSTNEGGSWSTPRGLHLSEDKERGPLWGPALVRHTDGQVWMFYSHSLICSKTGGKGNWAPGGDVRYITTTDGRTWSKPAVLHHQANSSEVPWVTANPPVVLPNGSMVLPVWAEIPRGSECAQGKTYQDAAAYSMQVQPSSAGGVATWTLSSPVVQLRKPHTWLIEGTIVALNNGELLQLFRTEVGFIYTSRSSDGGATWSEPLRTRLPSNNSKLHALVLSNGALVVAYNNHQSRANTDGVRSYLTVAVSRDSGTTWGLLASLETSTKPGYRFHYPTMLQVGCRLLVAYTISFKQQPWPGPKGLPSGIRLASIALEFSD